VVDDFEPWHQFVSSLLQKAPWLEIVGQAFDGGGAVQKVQELRPDLILLDIGLPVLNGIEVCQRIHSAYPDSRILIVTEQRPWEIAQEALRAGANGYLVKINAYRELLPAIQAVLDGKRFVGADVLTRRDNGSGADRPRGLHNVEFYGDDQGFLEDVAQFTGAALVAGRAAIVAMTGSHREALFSRLQDRGLDILSAIAEGRYIALDASDALSAVTRAGRPDASLFLGLWNDLIPRVAKAGKIGDSRIAIFGECVDLLWSQGRVDAAIEFERLGNRLMSIHDIDILCGYSLHNLKGGMHDEDFQRICAEHSAVYVQ